LATNFNVQIDPSAVLGVDATATLQEIRDAYRAKSKRYHPDAGGEEWAFRVLVQAYEIMSTARVRLATEREAAAPPRRPAQPPPTSSPFASAASAAASAEPFREEPFRPHARPGTASAETVRPGVREPAIDPAQVVDVEKMSIRYEASHVWLITEHGSENRLLSSCLNISWPGPDLPGPPESVPNAEGILRSLGEAFDALTARSRPVSARSSVADGRFNGWVSYPNDHRAQAGFATLRELLHSVGLVVNQWSRDLVIPRPSR
jgi:curved DNA-binding protein CbpA